MKRKARVAGGGLIVLAKTAQRSKKLTPKERLARKRRAEIAAKLRSIADASDESERLTADDFAVRINARA